MSQERIKLKYFAIFPEKGLPGSERADFVRQWVDKFMIPSGMATTNEEEANAYLVASGDGGMTKACRGKHSQDKVFFGINCGTLGFLMNQVKVLELLPVYLDELHLVTVNLMEGIFHCKNGEEIHHLAFNDIFCGGNIADFATYQVTGSLTHFRNRIVKGNGVFVSTPQGTTGFALNARGSSAVLPLDTNTWYVGGVATGPYPNSVVNPQEISIEISSRHTVCGYADGYDQEAKDIQKITIRPTDHHVTLGFIEQIDFESRRRELAHSIEVGGVPKFKV